MAEPAPERLLTVEEYLEFEQDSDVRHEYAGGRVFAMSGATRRHNRIAGNLYVALRAVGDPQGCQTYQSDVKVRVDDVFYYPDVVVTCDPTDDDSYASSRPCLIVEVLSESTAPLDYGEKSYNYRRLLTLQTYVLAHQDKRRLEVYRREPGGRWLLEVLEGEDVLRLPCPALELPLADVYHDF